MRWTGPSVWLLLVALAQAGCVNVRSSAFVCESQSDCEAPRVCESNWCVLPGGDGIGGGRDAGADDVCEAPENESGESVELHPDFAGLYVVYELGRAPGVPTPLGGLTTKLGAARTLLVAGDTEAAAGGMYELAIERGPCGHILGFDGSAERVADTPFIDASLAYAPGMDVLVYSEFPRYTLSQLEGGSSGPPVRTDLRDLGLPTDGDEGPGGAGFVPSGFGAAAGGLRIVTWPKGAWYQVGFVSSGSLLDISALTHVVDLPNTPGGFAYVPAGSPGFSTAALLISEWDEGDPSRSRVAAYDVDESGDPIVATRRDFLRRLPGAWGLHVDSISGDLLIASFSTSSDEVYLVRGFARVPEQ